MPMRAQLCTVHQVQRIMDHARTTVSYMVHGASLTAPWTRHHLATTHIHVNEHRTRRHAAATSGVREAERGAGDERSGDERGQRWRSRCRLRSAKSAMQRERGTEERSTEERSAEECGTEERNALEREDLEGAAQAGTTHAFIQTRSQTANVRGDTHARSVGRRAWAHYSVLLSIEQPLQG